jgi:hypothetical protein
MDDNQIIYILNIFAQYEHCFTLEDLSNFAEPDFDSKLLKHALLNDSRFILMNKGNSKKKYFIQKKPLKSGLCNLWGLLDSNQRPSACKADALNQLS